MLRKLIPAALFAAFLAVPATASAADQYCGPVKAKTAIIVIHGGYFVVGSPGGTADTCAAFAAKGWRVINIDYPLGDLNGAYNAVSKAAVQAHKDHRQVVAYGESAGGSLAALAAARRWVDGAFAWAPVSNLISWNAKTPSGHNIWDYCLDSSLPLLRKMSAYYSANPQSAPLRVVHGRSDTVVPVKQSRALKRKYPHMTLIERAGGHDATSSSYLSATSDAIKFFQSLKN